MKYVSTHGEQFKRIQDAFNRINARFDEEEANKSLNIFTFEVVLTKVRMLYRVFAVLLFIEHSLFSFRTPTRSP